MPYYMVGGAQNTRHIPLSAHEQKTMGKDISYGYEYYSDGNLKRLTIKYNQPMPALVFRDFYYE